MIYCPQLCRQFQYLSAVVLGFWFYVCVYVDFEMIIIFHVKAASTLFITANAFHTETARIWKQTGKTGGRADDFCLT